MSQDRWELLCNVKKWTPINVLGQQSAGMIDDDVYKLSESQYCLADTLANANDNSPRIVSVFWACSEKSFRRAYFKDVEGDDLLICTPPSELLPPKFGPTYSQILVGLKALGYKGLMEYASYRVMSDGSFIHKVIECDSMAYYFRSADFIDEEMPYAILWKMKDNK